MTKLLEKAIKRVSELPEAAQQSIAEDLIAHVKTLEQLRSKVQKGIDSLGRGQEHEIDIEQVIKAARAMYEQ